MDRLNDEVMLSNDDIAGVVGRLTLDNVALRKELARLQKLVDEPKEDAVRTE